MIIDKKVAKEVAFSSCNLKNNNMLAIASSKQEFVFKGGTRK